MARPAPELPSGAVTFLFTDIEGSTRLLQALGPAYPDVLAEHHRLLRVAVDGGGGVAIGTEGDSLFAAFASPSGALAAAVQAQQALATHDWPAGSSVRVRMGLHTGEALVRDGTYVGLDVHRAARIAAVGHGGQVLLSESTRALVQQSLPDVAELRDLGRHRLKDLTQPERIYEVVIAGLPAQFPALRSLDASPNNLPTQLTSFVGRAREVAEARRLLATTRLLTLTGPGGTGKTRLSLQLAAEVIADYPDGVFFVPLGPIDDPGLVAPAIVSALGLREAVNQPPTERLAEYLRDRRLLLVLDNFEQVLPAAAAVGELLKASAELRVVVTSRAKLHLYGEREYEVPPLALPELRAGDDPTELARYESVALFLERAAAVKPDFVLSIANAAAVAEICARLDGLPLAIELAAARVKLLPPQALLARLGRRLDMLQAGASDLPARQQTLHGAIAWSHDLLTPAARGLFACFSVFVSGADLEAAETVCGAEGAGGSAGDGSAGGERAGSAGGERAGSAGDDRAGSAGGDVLAGLAGLVDQSLIRQEGADGEPRFWMLFTIREFALEQLAASSAADTVGRRHAAYYLALAEAAAPGLTGSDQKGLLDRLDRENGNLRAAITWTLEHDEPQMALRLGSALWRFWQMRGLLAEGAEWLERILAMPGTAAYPRERASALEAAGGVAYWRADMDKALVYYEASLELCRQIGDRAAIANALYNAGFPTLVNLENVQRSREFFEESLAIYRELGDREALARVLWGLGNLHYYTQEDEAARDVLIEDVAIFRTMNDPFGLAWALHTLGLAYNRLGQTVSHAAPLWREALDHFARVGDQSGLTILLGDFGLVAIAKGEMLRAIRLNAASELMASTGGTGLGELFHRQEQTYREVAALDPADVAAAIEEGQRMSVQEAVEYAVTETPASPTSPRAARP
jgi:predicted ATPase/class 3 adenylate cyclase